MSRFRLHTKAGKKLLLSYLMAGTACAIAAGVMGYMVHSVGITRAKSRETVLIYTEEELEQYLVDTESEEYNLNGRYRLEENLDLSWMEYSIGTNLEPFTGKFDGNGHVISGLERPLFGVIKTAEIENLFFDDLTITRPFTYSDGERYVDGYGALTAYAVDSTIRNCGMSGGLYMASPSEAEYQLAKASPSEANENRGPGMPSTDVDAGQDANQESRVETSFDEENTGSIAGPGGDTEVGKTEAVTEIGPGVESTNEVGDNENSKPSENPGDQEKDQENDLENGKETVTSSVGNISSSTNEETDAIKQEPSKSTNGEIESTEVIAETTNGTAESLEETTDTTRETKDTTRETKDTTGETKDSAGETKDTTGETKDSTGETTGSTATAATEEPTRTVTNFPAQGSADHGTKTVTEDISGTAIEGTVPSETIGFRLNQRQSLMMKAPTAADFNIGELLEASPSDATPSDAQEMPDESRTEDHSREETEYIGNPGGDIYILVTAERVTAGGLAAQTAGDTLISESFAMVTIAADLEEIETYSGGLAGILGTGSRTENCYAVGLSDSTGTNGGFAAVNEGEIKNSYAVVTIGNAGTRRGAFTALERGSLTGCVYDRQIACAGEENTEFAELASPAEAMEFQLIGMKTSDMTGTESLIPGNWRKTEHAYPQLEYFSLHEDESAAANSKASVIALELPGELTLADIIKNGDIILPLEIDGEEIVWEAEGNIRIDEKHQVVSDDGNAVPTIEANDIPTVGSTLDAENAVTPETEPIEDNRDIGKKSDNSAPQLKAFVGNATRNFAITEVAVTATTYSDWVKVGEAVEKHEISGISPPVQNSEGYYEIENAEQLGWFASKVNNGETGLNAKITADIDLTGGNYGGTIDVPLEWVPMADNNGYSGTFDGGGYVIDYLSVNREVGRGGLFAEVNGAVIKNVQIGSHSSIITGSNAAGGIVSTVSDGKSLITDCINHAIVTTGDDHVGGIVGSVKDAGMVEISRCGNTGKISTSNGGLSGGLVGWVSSNSTKGSTITDSFNVGLIVTTGYNENGISGIAGSFLSKSAVVKNCYHAGTFSSTNRYPRYGIGRQTTAINSYYLNGGGAGTAITEAKMRSWAFPFCLNSQSMDGAWAYIPGQYPGFGTLARPESWETVGQGVMDGLVTGVTFTPESGVYKIGSAEQLAVFAATVNRGSTAINATLTMDISLVGERYGGSIASPIPWYPVGDENKTYKGTFDGAGKAIGYMRVEKDGFAGLFGCAGGGAVITGVGIDSSCKVTSTGDASGNGTAALLGAVKSDETAVTQITIQNCYSRAEVNGAGSAAFTAGFIGTYLGGAGGSESISNCYNAGKITAVDGTAGSAIAGTFLHGSGGGIKNCYWDSQTSGGVTAVVTGGGATVENCGGKTTAVMKSDGAGGILDLLNENLGAGTWYRVDTRNDGYPIFMKSESEIDWGDVGAAMMAPRSKHASSSPGTASDPYLIWTPENLAWFSYQVNQVSGNSGLCAELMTDLDLFGGTYSGHAYDTSNPGILSKALLWIPIGDGAVPYTGTFLGNDHTVRVMRAGAAAAENQGLFGTVGDGARISGLAVTESQVSAARYSGGIAGRIDGTGVVVNNCQITGKLTGDGDYFGGIAGMISGSGVTVTGCRNTGEITGTGNYIGGIAGAAQSSGSIVIDGCYSSAAGKIETTGASKTHIGGILGGGLAGSGTVTVRNCYNRGMVSAGSSGSQAGGIAGSAVQSTEIAGCYNAGQVTGNSACQSIAGANAGTGNISSCFYQNDCPADVNAKALSRSVLQTWGAAFALNGEQLSQSTGISWDYHAGKNDGYPWPAAETPGGAADWEDVGEAAFNGLLDGAVPALSGTTCQIATAEQLAWFAYRVNHEDYTASADLTADLNMDVAGSRYVSGRRLSWKPIGAITARAYDGVFQSAPDGRKIYQIQNLYVNDAAQAAGLFGIIGNGRVSRIGISNADVTGKVAGGIAGYLQGGEVSQCYNRGGSRVTSSSDEAGGVVGRLVTSTGCIKDCYNINTVIKSGSTAGGIAGRTDGAVKNCFNANLTGGSIAGADGTYAISSGSSTNMKQCYSDTSLGDSAYVGQLDCSDDTKLQTQTDLLNTVDGSGRKGTDRVWFTSLAEEETKGLPTLDAPEMYQIILSPAPADTGTTGSLENGISIPDAKLRRIHLEKDSTSTDAVNLTEAVTVAGNFHNYGTDNANANLGLKAGATDVSVLPQSLTTPTASLSSFSQMTLYTAAAYTHASERKLLLEASSGTTRYEISITIPGVTSKPLKVSLPVSVNMELDPNVGTQPISYSADLELKNLNDYPIKAFITSVEKLPGKDVILTPIAKSAVIDQFKPLAAAGIKLGITSPASGTDTGNIAGQPDGKIYYTPSLAGSAEKWMAGDLGYEKTLRYRYFIEHSRIQAAAGQSFGFKIVYKFEIPTGDNTGVVAVFPAS